MTWFRVLRRFRTFMEELFTTSIKGQEEVSIYF